LPREVHRLQTRRSVQTARWPADGRPSRQGRGVGGEQQGRGLPRHARGRVRGRPGQRLGHRSSSSHGGCSSREEPRRRASLREVVASARRGAGKEGGGASGHGRGGLEEKECRRQAWSWPWRATAAGRCTAMAVLGVRAQAQAGRASECQRELGRAIMEEQERDSGRAHSSGARQWWRRAPAWLPRTGHAPPFEEFYRACGGRRYGRRGESIWAASRLN